MIATQLYLTWLKFQLRHFKRRALRARAFQHAALMGKIARNADSDFGRDHGFASIRTVRDFRRQVPILSYEAHHSYIDRVLHGKTNALFHPQTRVLMFAMTSGTTGEPKRLPIPAELFREYRRGWLIWAAGAFGDHRHVMRRKTLQLSTDWELTTAPCGIPCGQISGLAAMTRPRIAQRMFMPPPIAARIHDSAAKHYTTLRLALASREIGMIITANPSTLVEFARRADSDRESLLRDIYNGTLSCSIPAEVRSALSQPIARREPERARELERLIEKHGALLPKHAWPELSLLAVWTGGSVGVFLPQLTSLYGKTAIRDHGLSASEGRMSIPLADNTAAGVLDYYHHFFEFIPVEEHGTRSPTVLEAHELEVDRDYYILMTTSGGLYRYDIHDVVRCVGFEGQAPLLEFLNKGKSFSNLTGEKLSEHQTIRAVERAFRDLGLPIDTFTLAPVMESNPRYVLLIEKHVHRGRSEALASRVQDHLERLNEEYAAKCASGRLKRLQVREIPSGTWTALRCERTSHRGNFEEYKHPCLVNDLSFVRRIMPPAHKAAGMSGIGQPPIPMGSVPQSSSSS